MNPAHLQKVIQDREVLATANKNADTNLLIADIEIGLITHIVKNKGALPYRYAVNSDQRWSNAFLIQQVLAHFQSEGWNVSYQTDNFTFVVNPTLVEGADLGKK